MDNYDYFQGKSNDVGVTMLNLNQRTNISF
jgi:hypothetical protein